MADNDSRSGLVYFTQALLDWTTQVHAPHDPALQQAFDAPAKHGMPAIQLAPSEARLTELLLRMAGARKVVEVGTLAGYSALRLARALPVDGEVHTIEFEPRHAEVAREVVAKAGESKRVTIDGSNFRCSARSFNCQAGFMHMSSAQASHFSWPVRSARDRSLDDFFRGPSRKEPLAQPQVQVRVIGE